jgi:beta-1,4-mannosyltransferase
MSYKLISLPGRGFPNPYIDLFYDALFYHNIEFVGEPTLDNVWFKRNINSFDAIHLHWPELIWRKCAPSLINKIRETKIRGSWRLSNYLEKELNGILFDTKLERFKKNIAYLKGQGKKILWTWHNVVPHENASNLNLSANQILAENADLIIFHSQSAKDQCHNSYNILSKTVVMPHGNYDGVYPPPRDSSIVMDELGLDVGKPVIGFMGNIRNYKGIDVACEALARLGREVQFLCAGLPFATFNLDWLKQEFSGNTHAFLIPRKISDQEFSDYANLCEFLLLPYKEITGSGALLASLTLKRGVVASDLPFFREILGETPEAGLLVKPGDPEALASAIAHYLNVPADLRSRAARNLADKYKWSEVVIPVAEEIHNRFMSD